MYLNETNTLPPSLRSESNPASQRRQAIDNQQANEERVNANVTLHSTWPDKFKVSLLFWMTQ